MTWDVDLTLMVRVLINDLQGLTRTDEEIQQTIVAACILVTQDTTLPYDYACDISAITITPDPVVVGDGISQALFPLKAACIINQGDFRTALGQGIKVRDGDSQIDTTAGFRGYSDILQLGPCQSYDKLLRSIEATPGVAGQAIYSPFRAGSGTGSIGFSTIAWYNQFSNTRPPQNRFNRF